MNGDELMSDGADNVLSLSCSGSSSITSTLHQSSSNNECTGTCLRVYAYHTVHRLDHTRPTAVAHTRLRALGPELISVIGSQPAGDIVIYPAVGCHYFPGVREHRGQSGRLPTQL